jgi:cytochrome c oxidase assembly protein subunit 15
VKANRGLFHFTIAVAAATLFLVVAGALVTSNEAGLSVPDWPLSYGQVMPEMTGGIFYEHGHRMVATTVGFLTIILAVWTWRVDDRPWMRRLGFAALGLVILQGVLGGMTVIFMLPKPVSIAHACLAQLFFSTTVAIALFQSEGFRRGPVLVNDGHPSLRTLAVLAPVLMLGQVALGAAYRHKALDLIPHVIGAALVTGFCLTVLVYVLLQHPRHERLRKSALHLGGAVLVQVFLGIASYMARIATSDAPQPMPVMVWLTVAHVAVGATAMSGSVIFAIQVLRNVTPSSEVKVMSGARAVAS